MLVGREGEGGGRRRKGRFDQINRKKRRKNRMIFTDRDFTLCPAPSSITRESFPAGALSLSPPRRASYFILEQIHTQIIRNVT